MLCRNRGPSTSLPPSLPPSLLLRHIVGPCAEQPEYSLLKRILDLGLILTISYGFFSPTPPTHAVYRALLGDWGYRMLIGNCNPMLRPIRFTSPGDSLEKEYAELFGTRQGLGTTTYSPLALGVLTGKYNDVGIASLKAS